MLNIFDQTTTTTPATAPAPEPTGNLNFTLSIDTTKPKTANEMRQLWKNAKQEIQNHDIDTAKLSQIVRMEKFSVMNYYFILSEMKKHNMEGTPYLDTLTFNKWKDAGYKVKKGEKSVLYAITFPKFTKKEEETDKETTFSIPKLYHLFHRSQVEKIS